MKRRGVIITLSITFLAVLFYGYRYLQIPVGTKVAVMTQREDIVSTRAYIIRTEEVYDAQISGTMYSFVEEGDRVAKNMCISTVYQGDVNAESIQNLNNINNRIKKLEAAKQKNEKFTTDSGSVDNTINNVRGNIIDAVINNNIQEIENYKATLKTLNHEEAENFDSELNNLRQQKSEIESQLNNNKSDINSTMSGIFSLNVDGYEEILTPQTIFTYQVSDFDKIPQLQMSEKTNNSVNSGESVCKIVDNHIWYAMAKVTKSDAEAIEAKKEVIIRFDDLPGSEVSATVEYISVEKDGESAVVVLKSDRYLEGVYGMRIGNMEIITNRHVGYEVPIHAIRVVDDKTGVTVSAGVSEFFCETDIVFSDESTGMAIIYPSKDAKRKLSVGDRIILGKKKNEEEIK